MSLQNKVLIITGTASGIGLSTAKLALDEGAKVLGVDISSSPSILAGRENWHFVQTNLVQPDAAPAVVKKCVETFGGRIDGLLNVAGVMDNNASADTVTDEMWDRCISINLTAPTKLIQAVLSYMRAQKAGSIVNVASKSGTSGASAGVAYTASKHGLVGVTKNVAWRFKDENIRCNAICPGGVATGITGSVDNSKFDLEASATMAPIHGVHITSTGQAPIQPDEIAQTLVFLVSDGSSKISGAIIPIDIAWSTI